MVFRNQLITGRGHRPVASMPIFTIHCIRGVSLDQVRPKKDLEDPLVRSGDRP